MVELTYTQIILLVGSIAFASYWLCRCDTKHWIKFHVNWWLDHDLVRWLDHTETRLENWNKTMTSRKWFILGVGIISSFFVPIIIWGSLIPESQINTYLTYVMIVEYLFLIGFLFYATLQKKPRQSKVSVGN